MNIDFHYFTVKTLCMAAGMSEYEAQIVSSYSQFVADYTVWENYQFLEVPDFAMCLVLNTTVPYEFYTVTTAFTSFIDDARLVIDKYQKEIAVPFHFIPDKRLNEFESHTQTREYRTKAVDIFGSDLICQLLDDAKIKYHRLPGRYELMRIGILLHIYADTYAHQLFSGFRRWTNFSFLNHAISHITGEVITAQYDPVFYSVLPSIGHANVNTAPDDFYITWNMKMASNKEEKYIQNYTMIYERNNPMVFIQMTSWQILLYICSCIKRPMVDENTWMDISSRLLHALNTTENDPKMLAIRWHRYFPNYQYNYDKDSLWKNALIPIEGTQENNKKWNVDTMLPSQVPIEKELGGLYKTATNDFFQYNVLAKEIRDEVIK
ncbi:DUF6765 family protein [Anaerosacchariphilus polymeriproducens]|uniref:Uncharacterized protein n=1 Tax=Anaerosacchariphilus polymeriproducens TaxID=1812858 RepID=A0A371AYN6_9FIRM|nr:DUF6765 family protein [Anaerosacchariphilus polymeriproducens]RDU24705.1 hypothetical protein DWV06_04345 [Anaerosacchariphilus polymeriproducens]